MKIFKIIKYVFSSKTDRQLNNCINCKHFAQGELCSFCANENQTDDDLKQYSYHSFGCNLFDSGIHQSRIDYMKNLGMAHEVKKVIELSELKIGNYLLYKGEVVHVTLLSMDIDDEYEDTIGFCRLGETSHELAAWNRSLYNDLERIPLTQEWIIKFQLHFNYGYEFAGIFNLFIEYGEPICTVCLEQYSEGREPLLAIRHVHQFQNLYSVLIGKELKVIQ